MNGPAMVTNSRSSNINVVGIILISSLKFMDLPGERTSID